MLLEEFKLESTKIKIYDNNIVENTDIQKEYIGNIVCNLLNKLQLKEEI